MTSQGDVARAPTEKGRPADDEVDDTGRPMRADARRNNERLVTAAARRQAQAGVAPGIGNFISQCARHRPIGWTNMVVGYDAHDRADQAGSPRAPGTDQDEPD